MARASIHDWLKWSIKVFGSLYFCTLTGGRLRSRATIYPLLMYILRHILTYDNCYDLTILFNGAAHRTMMMVG